MKATKLIEILQAGINQFGDLNVEASVFSNYCEGAKYIAVDIKYVTTEAYCDGKVFSLRDWKDEKIKNDRHR